MCQDRIVNVFGTLRGRTAIKGIRQLADHLDISIGTVSRALNGRPDVNAETRQRVLDAAIELGYVPNQSGRSLRRGATQTVGFMIESDTARAVRGDDFFMGVVSGIQTVLKREGLDLVLLPCAMDEDPLDYVKRVVARRFVDALIISATRRVDPRIEFLTRAKLPFVTLGRSRSGKGYAWIDLDFEGIAKRSVTRLAAAGHRRIAITVPVSDVNLGDLFLGGYRAGLEECGLEFDEELVLRCPSSEAGGAEAGRRLAATTSRPTAILLVDELQSIGLYHTLREAGLEPGADVAIIGLRESPQTEFLRPRLTAHHLSLRDLGEALGTAVLAEKSRAEDRAEHRPFNLIWQMDLVGNESDGTSPTHP